MNLQIFLCFLVLNASACYAFFWRDHKPAAPTPSVWRTIPPTLRPNNAGRPVCPCQTNLGPSRYANAGFVLVGKVTALNFVPRVPPTGYSSIIVEIIKDCKGFGTKTVRLNALKSNAPCPAISGDTFDNLMIGGEYLFFGTYKRLAPDNRLSFVVDRCGPPCNLRNNYKGTCPATISNAICKNY